MMSGATLQELLDLPVAERLELIEKLWKSLEDSEDFGLTDSQKTELDRRIADHDAHPEDTASVDEVLDPLAD